MPTRYAKRLFMHLSHRSYEPSDVARLAADLQIPADELGAFSDAVRELAANGEVVWGDHDLVTLPPLGDEVIGSFRRNPKGFGFIVPEQLTSEGDLFVPAQNAGDAVTGDRVRAKVVKQRSAPPGKSPYVGEIVEVLERKRTTFAGTVRKQGPLWVVDPDGKAMDGPIVVRDAESKNARAGVKVVVEVTDFPEGDYLAEGVITKVLGEAGRPDVETQAVIDAYNLPGDFPEACNEEARAISAAFERTIDEHPVGGTPFDETERLDIRDKFVFTIDPPDAKDYDDALSIERVSGGRAKWRLGVHIADVSQWVQPGSALDNEAVDRGNSTYLPRFVIPMLPEILSNGICSLQEGVPRFCKSAFIDYDERGNVVGQGFAATVIESRKRLTYIEAQCLIDGNEEGAKRHARTEPNYSDELLSALKEINALSKAIRERRRRQGMIHLDLPDVELIYDEEGRVVDAEPEDDSYTHTLIEMCMVEANEAVARLFEDLEVPIIRRIHPAPVPGNTDQLRDFVKVAGFRIPKNPTREELQSLLDATAGTPAAPAVHFAVLRTLTRAEYSPALIGHFALASEGYAHFTSPIRRYADLTVHRALTRYLEMTRNGTQRPADDGARKKLGLDLKNDPVIPAIEDLRAIAGGINSTEERSTEAERELRHFLVLQLLSEHIGESYQAVVTGVTGAGVFVRLDKYLAEGLIKTSDLPTPEVKGKPGVYQRVLWQVDRKTGAMVEQNSGRSFNLGDRLDVTILEVDLLKRTMNLGVTNAQAREHGKAKKTDLQKQQEQGGGGVVAGLTFGDVQEHDKPRKTGAQKRSQRSKSRDKRKSDHRSDRKNKGKRQ
ncbi:MAG: VacB/RNase II family 3'-5' exoribonuclease [Phycisphaerales bacterium]